MSRIDIPGRQDTAASSLQPLFHFVSRRFGFVPDLYRILSISPHSLTGLMEMQAALSRTLDVRTHERIAIAVSEVNGCDYCISAHSYIGHYFAKLIPEEIALNRMGRSLDRTAEAAVRFARKVSVSRGKVETDDLNDVRAAGYSDAQIVEIIALCAQVFLTNLLANVFDIQPDFPEIGKTGSYPGAEWSASFRDN
ncbi:carboxymuconolactone decarboxylase family protein [Paraburkholderia sp. CNPSo 3157]|uniref:Carboxymuconolactone decarboxylase family protein n=1 Tax=Paraburkholderia franconis TaxID=2654983 RepID=A0A7X1NJ77_9BURK|nr:carboxymuconolactone decarboxylase family protein [Paraburkholderia franconis]MPW22656.1 carboxymuconolactone decarboxylase family protein [Paraburkholderia franconis]